MSSEIEYHSKIPKGNDNQSNKNNDKRKSDQITISVNRSHVNFSSPSQSNSFLTTATPKTPTSPSNIRMGFIQGDSHAEGSPLHHFNQFHGYSNTPGTPTTEGDEITIRSSFIKSKQNDDDSSSSSSSNTNFTNYIEDEVKSNPKLSFKHPTIQLGSLGDQSVVQNRSLTSNSSQNYDQNKASSGSMSQLTQMGSTSHFQTEIAKSTSNSGGFVPHYQSQIETQHTKNDILINNFGSNNENLIENSNYEGNYNNYNNNNNLSYYENNYDSNNGSNLETNDDSNPWVTGQSTIEYSMLESNITGLQESTNNNQLSYNIELSPKFNQTASIGLESPRNHTSVSVNEIDQSQIHDYSTALNTDNTNIDITEEDKPIKKHPFLRGSKKNSNMPSNFFFFQQKFPEIPSSIFYEWYCMSLNCTIIFFICTVIAISIIIGNASVQGKYETVNYSNPVCQEILWDNSKTVDAQLSDLLPPSDISNFKCMINLNFKEKWEPPIYMHYELTNFFQAHRLYGKSISAGQLGGNRISSSKAYSTCQQYYSYLNDDQLEKLSDEDRDNVALAIHPCGLTSHAMFNDTFILVDSNGNQICNTTNPSTNCTDDGITFNSESQRIKKVDEYTPSEIDFIQLKSNLSTTPSFYPHEPSHKIPKENNDYREWIRTSPFNKAIKSFRIIDTPLEGEYKLYIHSVYPADTYGGSKIITFRKLTWFGTPNWTMAIFYIILAVISLLISISCLIIGGVRIFIRYSKKLNERKL